jgi:hypothetical protein
MQDILQAAGVPESVKKLISSVVDTCRICRMWVRPQPKSMATSRITTRFGEVVQCDLLFVEEMVILHLIDEATRWTATALLAGRKTSDVLPAITATWLRIFGAMDVLVSDQEGALASEEGAVWCERWGISLRLKPKGSHAQLVERHHEVLRQIIHRVRAEARSLGLTSGDEDIVSEATFAKNAIINVAGATPFQAVFGRIPLSYKLSFQHVQAPFLPSRNNLRRTELAGLSTVYNQRLCRITRVKRGVSVQLSSQQLSVDTGLCHNREAIAGSIRLINDLADPFDSPFLQLIFDLLT